MDVQEVRKLKLELENKILELVKKYEDKTQTDIEDISLEPMYRIGSNKADTIAVHVKVEV